MQAIIDCVDARGRDRAGRFPDGRGRRARSCSCTAEVDEAFLRDAGRHRVSAVRATCTILYSPLHGVGASAVCPLLARTGFRHVECIQPHADTRRRFSERAGARLQSGESARVRRDRSSTPSTIGRRSGPGHRSGLRSHGLRRTADAAATAPPWATLNGNQLGALLADYVLERRQAAGTLSPQHYLVKTLVTTELIRRIGDSYGVRTCGDLPVGFKWIGGVIDEEGPAQFVLGSEESHGYLVGQYARDKDGAVACLLMAELAAAQLKAAGKSRARETGRSVLAARRPYRATPDVPDGRVRRAWPRCSG